MSTFPHRWSPLIAGGFLFAAGAGGCLPNNFYSDLAGETFSGVVGAFVDALVQQLLTPPV